MCACVCLVCWCVLMCVDVSWCVFGVCLCVCWCVLACVGSVLVCVYMC